MNVSLEKEVSKLSGKIIQLIIVDNELYASNWTNLHKTQTWV